jgi:hypothetical protein
MATQSYCAGCLQTRLVVMHYWGKLMQQNTTPFEVLNSFNLMGQDVTTGDTVHLTEAQAAQCLNAGLVTPLHTAAAPVAAVAPATAAVTTNKAKKA